MSFDKILEASAVKKIDGVWMMVGRLVANVVECSGRLWCPGGVGVMKGAGVEPLSAFEKGYGFENVMGARRSVLHGRRCRASSRGSEW